MGDRVPRAAGAIRGVDRIANGKLTQRYQLKREEVGNLCPFPTLKKNTECSQLFLHKAVTISNITSFLYLREMTSSTSCWHTFILLYIPLPLLQELHIFPNIWRKVVMSIKQEMLRVGNCLERLAQSVGGDSSLLIYYSEQCPFKF